MKYTAAERVLVIVFFAMIFAAPTQCVYESLDTARQNSHLKRTMADLRNVGNALEARATDFNHYNAAGAASTVPIDSDGKQVPYRVSPDVIRSMLEPKYMKHVPLVDGWGHPLEFWFDRPFPATSAKESFASSYLIRSPGRDGVFQKELPKPCPLGWDCDVVFTNGSFMNLPLLPYRSRED